MLLTCCRLADSGLCSLLLTSVSRLQPLSATGVCDRWALTVPGGSSTHSITLKSYWNSRATLKARMKRALPGGAQSITH